jgi:hypothetical protein
MPDATITSTASTFGTISGTFAADQSTVTGTVTAITGSVDGSVGVPGPQGQQGIQGIQGDPGSPGAPGQGVAVGGTTGQVLQKLSATNYDTGWLTLPSDFITSVTAPLAVGSGVLSVDLSAYLTTSAAASTYYLQTNPSGFQTAANVTTALSPYLLSATAASTYAVIAAGQPVAGSTGQVLTKQSGTNYDSIWVTPVVGDRYLTTSTTSLTINNANKTLTIGTGLSYTPTQNITISYDAAHHMHGEVLTYNSGTGVLTVDINHHTGSGTYASWVVNVGGVTPATSVDFSDITGAVSGNTNLQAALNLKLDATTAASDYLSKAGNLSGLANTATARTNLLLGATNTVAFRAVNLSEGAPEISDTLSTLNVITSSGNYGVGGSTASYVDDGSGSAIVSESGSFGLDKNNFSLALYPTYDSSNPSSPTSGIELNYVTATGVLSLRAYDNPGSTDYVTTLSPFGLILPASGGSITFGDATVQTTAFPGFAGYATETFVTSQGYITSAGVPAFATTEQAALNSSATTVISPANFRVAGLTTNVWAPGVAAMSTVVLGTGANVGSTTTVLNGRLLAPNALTAGYACRGFNLFLLSNSANAGYNFGTPSGHSIKIYGDLTPVTVGVKIRAVFGRQNNTLLAPATLASRGYGWEWNFATSTLSIIAHNGTTLTTTAVTWVPLAARNYEITTTSSGTGTISLYVDGALLGTSSGGPTTFSAAGQLWWQTEIQNEVTATAQREFYFQNPKVYTTNG